MLARVDHEQTPRPHCYRCDKPASACLCQRIPLVANRTPIMIVQHKRESRHALGTARIANLGLEQRHIAVMAASERSGEARPPWLPEGAGLLYPAPESLDLAGVSGNDKPRALVVIDGTWHQARALFRDHAWLRQLPRYRLTPSAPSRYRLRKEPAAHCISTIEAIVQALAVLEPETDATGLLSAFEALIDDQIQHLAGGGRQPRLRELRPIEWRRLPRGLIEDYSRLVIVYGEATHPEGVLERPPELVQWSALRLRDQSVFDCVVRPLGGMPSAGHLRHLELDRSAVEAGATPDEFRASWAAFLKPDDLVAPWNPRTLTLLERNTGAPVAGFGLKGAYHRVRSARGDLDEILASERALPLSPELEGPLNQVRGRARRRLENALRATQLLRRLALEARP